MPDPAVIQRELAEYFERNGLSVAVGLTKTGVAIRSQDERVDAANLKDLRAFAPSDDHVVELRGWIQSLERTRYGTKVTAIAIGGLRTATLEYETYGPPPAYLAEVRCRVEVDQLTRDLPFTDRKLPSL